MAFQSTLTGGLRAARRSERGRACALPHQRKEATHPFLKSAVAICIFSSHGQIRSEFFVIV